MIISKRNSKFVLPTFSLRMFLSLIIQRIYIESSEYFVQLWPPFWGCALTSYPLPQGPTIIWLPSRPVDLDSGQTQVRDRMSASQVSLPLGHSIAPLDRFIILTYLFVQVALPQPSWNRCGNRVIQNVKRLLQI